MCARCQDADRHGQEPNAISPHQKSIPSRSCYNNLHEIPRDFGTTTSRIARRARRCFDPLGPRNYGLVSGVLGCRSKIANIVLQESYEMNLNEPCLCRTCAKAHRPSVHGRIILRNKFVGGVLLVVDDHVMGGDSMERSNWRSGTD